MAQPRDAKTGRYTSVDALVVDLTGDSTEFTNMLTRAEEAIGPAAMGMKNLVKESDKTTEALSTRFVKALHSAGGHLQNWGSALTEYVTLPILGLLGAALELSGVSFKDLDPSGIRGLQREFALLHRELVGASRELIVELIPYFRMLIQGLRDAVHWVRDGVIWWRGLSAETKRYVVAGAALLAILGPTLYVLGSIVSMIGTMVSAVSAVTSVIFGWGGALLLIVAGAALVTDAILQMTGKGNIGVLDMVEHFRVGGKMISTWLTYAFLEIFKGWEWTKTQVLMGLEILKFSFMAFGTWLYNMWIDLAVDMGTAMIETLVNNLPDALKNLLPDAMKDAGIVGSAAKALGHRDTPEGGTVFDMLGALRQIEEQSTEQQRQYDQAIHDLFKEDDQKRQQEEARGHSNTPGQEGLPHDILHRASSQSSRDFQEVSLARFALSGPGGMSSRPTQKQEVADTKTHDLLGLINEGVRAARAAVLGE